jgi:hypothetical protein
VREPIAKDIRNHVREKISPCAGQMIGVHEQRRISVGKNLVSVDVWKVALRGELPVVRLQDLDETVRNDRSRHRAIDEEDVDSASRGDLD